MENKMRIGIGYDVHPLAVVRNLVLGGVEIPFDMGLDGWSDADVLTHAVIDALLGAALLGDIGTHFPPGDERYEGISSLILLKEVSEKIREKGFRVGNIDVAVLAEEPVLAGYISGMRENLSRVLGIEMERVSVKAGTGKGLGFIGRREGIVAHAVALLEAV